MYNYLTVEETTEYIRNAPQGDLGEWGTYSGNTLRRLIECAIKVEKPFITVWSFDAFMGGLPQETEGVYINPDWVKGAFDISADRGYISVEEAIKAVSDYVGYNVTYVPGYFADTLTPQQALTIGERSLSYAHIDCDIHSSSKQVLEFLFKYKLIMENGLIRFDDICSTPANGGQKLALTQCLHKYQPVLNQLSANLFQLIRYA